MIKKVEMYTVICDHCKDDAGRDSEYAGWSDEDYSVESAVESGWITDGDKHYCGDCWGWDDNDEIELNPERKDKYATQQ